MDAVENEWGVGSLGPGIMEEGRSHAPLLFPNNKTDAKLFLLMAIPMIVDVTMMIRAARGVKTRL
ncbi:hypothetical protein OkiPb00232_30360 [Escherichia coli]